MDVAKPKPVDVADLPQCSRHARESCGPPLEPIAPTGRPTLVMTTWRRRGRGAARLLLTAGLVLLTASCGAQAGPARPSGPSGRIFGVVEARPGCPVERPIRLCRPRPVDDAKVEARSRSGATATTRTGADGRYSLRVGHGRYVVSAAARQLPPRCPHVPVSVTARATVRADIRCDSGIR